MKIQDRFKLAFNAFTNSSNDTNPRRNNFLRNGNKKMFQEWTQAVMSDRDMYTGYMYGAINNRANGVVELGEENLKTKASDSILDLAKRNGETVRHPYLDIIDQSLDFTNDQFWFEISTYLDLEGVYYLMALRNQGDFNGNTRTGEIQEFKLLNPYDITPVRDKGNKELVGYREIKDGEYRVIPTYMIIPMKRLNPFNRREGYSMSDAAKDSQFTLKQSSDHTRHSIQHNVNAPGIITTAVELEGEQLTNFKARVMGHVKGEPIFGTGSDKALVWEDMQIDLDKAALKDINQVNVDGISAVSGNARTMFGIEQSGTTRDTARIQSELLTGKHIIPQLRYIIGALNLDYKRYYPEEYATKQYMIYIDSPLKVDRDAELKDTEIKTMNFDLYSSLVNKGYSTEIASKYVEGEITLEELGEPSDPPEPKQPTVEPENASEKETFINEGILQSGPLQNSIMQTDAQIIGKIVDRLTTKTNAYTEEELLTKREQREFEKELDMILAAFYTIVFSTYGASLINKRAGELGKTAIFRLNNDAKKYIASISNKAAKSHIDTVLKDAIKTVNEKALAGASQSDIVSALQDKYAKDISQTRAKTIARTETNRAFTMTQYQADIQFAKQNNITAQAFKKWRTNSSNPCGYCQELASKPPIPLDKNFASIGDELSSYDRVNGETVLRKRTVEFADLQAGNAHPNCACDYELIIEENV